MTLVEFRQWAAYFEIENFNHSNTDINIGRIARLITNYLCKDTKSLKFFLPFEHVKRQSREQVESIFLMISDAVEENKKRAKKWQQPQS